MQIFFWTMFGAVTGWYTGKFMLSQGEGQWMTMLVGIAAAIGGGFLFDATSFHWEGKMIYTSLASIMAAVVLTTLYQYAVVRREFSPANR